MVVIDPEVAKWVMESVGNYSPSMTAIGDIQDGKVVAGIAFERMNKNCIWGHQRIDKPPTRMFWRNAADYIFNYCGCKKFCATVEASNEKAIKLNLHLGFVIEATLKDSGEYGDLLVMTLWRENCGILSWGKK